MFQNNYNARKQLENLEGRGKEKKNRKIENKANLVIYFFDFSELSPDAQLCRTVISYFYLSFELFK